MSEHRKTRSNDPGFLNIVETNLILKSDTDNGKSTKLNNKYPVFLYLLGPYLLIPDS